jgi:hypothetical protein
MAVFAVLGYTFVDWRSLTSGGVVVMAVLVTIAVLGLLVVTWFYWIGRNWARWFTVASALPALWNLTLLPSSTPFLQVVIITEALFFGPLPIWLNTRRIRAYFVATNRGGLFRDRQL